MTIAFSTKIEKVENKILDVSCFVYKMDYNDELSDVESKYFTTSAYKNFKREILETKRKRHIIS